jgi:hypothetical protein
MTKFRIHWLIAGFLLIGLPARAQVVPPPFVFDNGRDAENIPFELAGNHIYVHARVNNGAPLWFLFDSGAAENALLIDPKKVVPSPQSATLRLAGVTLNSQILQPQPLNFASSDGHRLDGVLTYAFIRNFVINIDYAARTLSLYDPKNFRYEGMGERVKLVALEADNGANVYLADLTVSSLNGNPTIGHFIVDTGVRLALTVNTPFVVTHDLLASQKHTLTAVIGSGLSIRDTTLVLGRVPSVAISNIALKNVIAGFSQYKSGVLAASEFDGIVGGDFLRRFRVILDEPHSEMILEKNAQFAEPFEYDMSGAMLLAEGENFDTFRIHAVMAGSPAEEAGLREGDRVVGIDGKAASAFSLQSIQELFRQPGASHILQIARGDQTVNVTLKLRRLI